MQYFYCFNIADNFEQRYEQDNFFSLVVVNHRQDRSGF